MSASGPGRLRLWKLFANLLCLLFIAAAYGAAELWSWSAAAAVAVGAVAAVLLVAAFSAIGVVVDHDLGRD